MKRLLDMGSGSNSEESNIMFLMTFDEGIARRPKHVFLTGASGGIGQAIARRMAADGYAFSLLANRHPERLIELQKEMEALGAKTQILQANVADRAALEIVFDRARSVFGPIDILINSAGIAQQKLFTEISDEDWQQMLDVHLTATFHTCQLVVPDMIRQHYGRIINITSIWGEAGASMEVHYSAVKAGIIGLSKALAKELGPSGITVNCVSPGVIDTEMNGNLSPETLQDLCEDTPLGRRGMPMDVAAAVAFLASDEASFITGSSLAVNGGFLI